MEERRGGVLDERSFGRGVLDEEFWKRGEKRS